MEEDYGCGSSDAEFLYDDDDDDLGQGFDDDINIPECNCENLSCKVIRKESLLAAQKDDLQRVMDLLLLKEHHARTLLIHYCWNADKIFAEFVEKGKERLYAEAGVSVPNTSNLGFCHVASVITCEICYEDFSASETTTMDCGHCFCNECWTKHFIFKINEGQSRRIVCMSHKCYSICDEGSIRNLVRARDVKLAEKFDCFLLESYIEDNKSVKWCPSVPHCGNAVRVDGDECREVECACGQQFCFSCSSEPHSPCSCVMWQHWVRKCKDESKSVEWITENTKFCPKCHKPVEKNGGCNLVYCICRQSFCWLCGDATGFEHTWTTILGHDCGRYKKKNGQKAQQHAQKEVWRYTHYYNRHKAHQDSLKAEEKLKEKLQQKIATLESGELGPKDYSWISNGYHRLIRSRKFLAYSYPFAYYMFGDELFEKEMNSEEKTIKQNLFEDQQQQLEANIERLSMFLEEPFANYTEEKNLEIKFKVDSLSTVTDKFCGTLFECIENELLSNFPQATHKIAPYKSKGVEKASELPDCFSSKLA